MARKINTGGKDILFDPAAADIRMAATAILKSQFRYLDSNGKATADRISPAWLHDFRVAIRRTRVMLGQLRDIFPVNEIVPFKQHFTALGQATNQLRDYDVLLEGKTQILKILPEKLRPAMQVLFTNLRRQRRRRFLALVQTINAAPYRKAQFDWKHFLDNTAALPASPQSQLPVSTAVIAVIQRRFNKFPKPCAHPALSDAALHKVRIKCKKLRYLLEFFFHIMPKENVRIIRELKKLQTLLGEHNDLAAQIKYFEGKRQKSLSGQKAAAIGAVITVFSRKKTVLRNQYKKALRKFNNAATKAFFASLAAMKKSGKAYGQ